MAGVKVQAIKYKQMKPKVVLDAIKKELERENGIRRRMLEKTVRTWTNKPDFEERIVDTPKTLRGEVVTTNKIYRYVNDGTSVRHAVMSRDFKAKTQVRVLGSRRGRGGVVFISRKIKRPGIKAREFTKEVARRRKSPYQTNMARVINIAAKKVF